MNDYQIKITNNKKDKAVSIELTGLLNVSNISNIKTEISTAINKSKQVELNINNVEDVDLSLIQFLIALKQHSKSSKFKITINLNLNNESPELFNRAGFSNILN